MSNRLANWWRSRQFHTALKQGNIRLAEQLLQEIQKSGARLSWLEKLFRDKLQSAQSAQSAHQYKKEAATLRGQLTQASQKIEYLEQIKFYQPENLILKPEVEFINFILKTFNLIEHDEYKMQSTGIDKRVFDNFEASLVEYLKLEFDKFPAAQLRVALRNAHEDIDRLIAFLFEIKTRCILSQLRKIKLLMIGKKLK